MPHIEEYIKQQARELGFELVGIARATPADGFDRMQEWLSRGFAGEMQYLHRHADARRHPGSVLADVRSVVMVGLCYEGGVRGQESGVSARVARYARGADYQHVIRGKLKELLRRVQTMAPECHGRGVVDTAPLLERDFARKAGLGWFGKNTMLLNKRLGSYFFLGALLLDIELSPDEPHEASHCGTCTACLDACPTDAFAGPGWLDSRRCISYLTIELRGTVPEALRSGIGAWGFGCDVCQEVCPWNRKAPPTNEPAFAPRDDLEHFDPVAMLEMADDEFRMRFRGTALLRAGAAGMRRNAAVVLGNLGSRDAIPALQQACETSDPVLQETAEWAIRQIQVRRLTASPAVADNAESGVCNETLHRNVS